MGGVRTMCATAAAAMVLSLVDAHGDLPPQTPPTPEGLPIGSKTPYWMPPPVDAPVDPTEGDPDAVCTEVYMQQIGRHGSRYGKPAPFDGLAATLAAKGAAIGNPELAFLKTWTNPFDPKRAEQLTPRGKAEWYAIGRRTQARYNTSVLAGDYNPPEYPVRTTYLSRTGQSAASFVAAALQNDGELGACGVEPVAMYSVYSGAKHPDGDVDLRFFKNCAAFTQKIDDNATHPSAVEPAAYLAVNITREVLPRMTRRMGLDVSVWNLTATDALAFWTACSMETSVFNAPRATTTCAVFSPEDYAMLNFYEDLDKYWSRGPGDPLASAVACPLAQRILADLAAKAADVDGVAAKAEFKFAHAETMLPLLTFFGLYAGGPRLTASMPADAAMQRAWRSYALATMAVNLRFVLHRCTSRAADGAPPTFKVELQHSERQVRWPRCGAARHVPFCTPEALAAAYPAASACAFEELCTV